MKPHNASDIFSEVLDKLYQDHLPEKHPFFQRLKTFPSEKLCCSLLGHLHLRYQAACHATRVMVYYIPYLDSPALRVRKLRLINDDDGLENGDTHHYQLTRAFASIGATILIKDEEFGCLDNLKEMRDPATNEKLLDLETRNFLSLVQKIYPNSLGPWCVIEKFADNWMRALMNSLSVCFPLIKQEPYFADCFNQGVEERHAQEALKLTNIVLANSPKLLDQTIKDAKIMAIGLDKFWSSMENLLQERL